MHFIKYYSFCQIKGDEMERKCAITLLEKKCEDGLLGISIAKRPLGGLGRR
jgi:hypothetical protein